MNLLYIILLASLGLFCGMAVMPFFGYKIAQWQVSRGMSLPDNSSVVTVMSALFALLGLLIAFTFSGAFSRFDDRRGIIVAEANNIGTAYTRLQLLPDAPRRELQRQFKQYTASRAEFFDTLIDRDRALAEIDNATRLQLEIWDLAVVATSPPSYQPMRMLLLPPLNDMFDIATVRTVAVQTHPPVLIFIALCAVALMCAVLVGYSANTSKRYRLSSVHVIAFAAVISFIFYVILDVEYARYGLVKLERVNQLLVDLHRSMHG